MVEKRSRYESIKHFAGENGKEPVQMVAHPGRQSADYFRGGTDAKKYIGETILIPRSAESGGER